MSSADNGTISSERRHHQRYRIQVAAQVGLAGSLVEAETLDISSGGVLLRTNAFLPVGLRVQWSLAWPAALNER
jgi:hypothetical protein